MKPFLRRSLLIVVRFFGRWRDFSERLVCVLDGSSTNKPPDVFVERTELFLDFQALSCIGNRGINFEAIANNARVAKKTLHISFVITSYLRWVEAVECLAVIFALVQNGLPRESRLCTFQHEKFKEGPIIMRWDAPFFVMVLNHE